MMKNLTVFSLRLFSALLSSLVVVSAASGETLSVQLSESSLGLELLSQSGESARARLDFTSKSGKTTSITVSVGKGEAVEYFFETLAQHSSVDLFGQCPNTVPNTPVASVRFEWSETLGLGVLIPTADGAQLSYSSLDGQFAPNVERRADETAVLVYGADEEFEPGYCFPPSDTPPLNISLPFNPDRDGSDQTERDLAAPILDAETCEAAMQEACSEPFIVNKLVTIASDSGSGENFRGGDQEQQRKRRLLSRALKSGSSSRIQKAVRSVRVFLRALKRAENVEASSVGRIQRIESLLTKKGRSREAALRQVIALLR